MHYVNQDTSPEVGGSIQETHDLKLCALKSLHNYHLAGRCVWEGIGSSDKVSFTVTVTPYKQALNEQKGAGQPTS